MEQDRTEKSIGFQRLACKKPGCSYLFKEIYFSPNWTAVTAQDSGVALTRTDGEQYYLCPQCTAKNIVIRQGEKIILEKIVRFEIPSMHSISAGTIPAGHRRTECSS
jgi:Zn finger protein HypA/HybF involved in hydrogenase expression